MEELAETLESLARTGKTGEKIAIAAGYLRKRDPADLSLAALYLSGRLLPLGSSANLAVGWRLILDSFADFLPPDWGSVYRRFGDLGDTVQFLLAEKQFQPQIPPMRLAQLAAFLQQIAGIGGKNSKRQKLEILQQVWHRISPLGTKYLVRLLLHDLRVGLKEGLLESAVAEAFSVPLAAVRRANLLISDIGSVASLAAADRLGEASLQLGRPCRFMLAESIAGGEEPFRRGARSFLAEDKYDGIRAQLHRGDAVQLFSRNLEPIGRHFPELEEAAVRCPNSFILDGEIVAYRDGIQPFALLQQRLHRLDADRMRQEIPVTFFAFDLLYFEGESLLDQPLRQRREMLAQLTLLPSIQRAHQVPVENAAEVESAFQASRQRGNEGLVLKEPASVYTPGKRGKQWLKYKKELTTLDCIVVAAEWGHGKRAGLLSDVVFAVRDEHDQLRTIGKAYSGLTDQEIGQMTAWFLAHQIRDEGWRIVVQPDVVIEVAFNRIQQSHRHDSGYALRFPRIKRIRQDKAPGEIDTLETARRIYETEGR
jgi:DNA ligase-1